MTDSLSFFFCSLHIACFVSFLLFVTKVYAEAIGCGGAFMIVCCGVLLMAVGY